jgi:predicted nucleotide-binding protein
MARRKATERPEQGRRPSLAQPRHEVDAKIRERIAAGEEIHNADIRTEPDLENARARMSKWDSYNVEYLKRCFDSEVVADEYDSVSSWGSISFNPDFGELISGFRDGIRNKITELESILERLELIPEVSAVVGVSAPKSLVQAKPGNSVFIVHGHDEAAKNSVARFVEKLGLKPIILHEQPNLGRTIIEKFEANASTASYAVVLLTPDDVGTSKDTPHDVKKRARQNVVLELGYFTGVLGRKHVCVLYKEGVEIPSDYMGIIYTPLDSADGWHLRLAKEMKEAGLEVDLNKAL